MGAVRRREGIVDEKVAERGELRDEAGIVLLLAAVESGVLEAEDLAVRKSSNGRLRRLPDAIRRECHWPLQHLGDGGHDWGEGSLRIRALRPAEMGKEDDFAALVGNFPDRR